MIVCSDRWLASMQPQTNMVCCWKVTPTHIFFFPLPLSVIVSVVCPTGPYPPLPTTSLDDPTRGARSRNYLQYVNYCRFQHL